MPAQGKAALTRQAGRIRLLVMLGLFAAVVLAIAYQANDRLATVPRVTDHINLLSPEERDRIARVHDYLLSDYDIDYRILIARGIDDINQFAVNYFRDGNVGAASDSGRGLLLVIDAQANQVRLEVSHALEPTYTDAFVAYIEHRQMTEFFAANRIADGILATTEMLITRATNAANGLDPSTESWAASSGGGGARVDARIGEGTASRRDDNVALGGGAPPREVLDRYRRAMEDRNNNPQLSIYSKQTREMLGQRVMTPAQMDNVAKSLRNCQPEKLFNQDNRAVLRYPIKARTCPPYFFLREDNQWRLDFTVMINAIRFGRNNEWRLMPGYSGPYGFAFRDLRFDRNGYPYPQ
ncbi:MAG: TPM domain-containing protein [Marinobacter sp.]|nr:TPM domain-containing protein [Marinobacter sp.]